ncbi:MAG: CopG family antitoxin [Chthoniobacteraceae bacterium]
MKVILRWTDIPHFDSEEDEAAFWAGARLDVRLMNSSVLKADTRDSTTITLRFDPRMLARIKRLARSRFLNYQSMIKQWLSERMEKELGDR